MLCQRFLRSQASGLRTGRLCSGHARGFGTGSFLSGSTGSRYTGSCLGSKTGRFCESGFNGGQTDSFRTSRFGLRKPCRLGPGGLLCRGLSLGLLTCCLFDRPALRFGDRAL